MKGKDSKEVVLKQRWSHIRMSLCLAITEEYHKLESENPLAHGQLPPQKKKKKKKLFRVT